MNIDQNSIFRGYLVHNDMPILMPMASQMAHQIFVGSSRSGKTAYLQMLIEMYLARGDTSIVVFDNKGDSHELLQAMYAAAPVARSKTGTEVPVQIFTDRPGYASNLFSLFDQAFWRDVGAVQRTDITQAALGIPFSRVYGQSYFYDCSATTVKKAHDKYPDARSFAELAEHLDVELKTKELDVPDEVLRDGRQTQLILDRIGACDPLNPRPYYPKEVYDNAIDMARFYKEPCCLHISLNAMTSPVASPENARVLFSSLLFAGIHLEKSERKTNIVLINDEWQVMLSAVGVFDLALAQARAVGVSLLLSNQVTADWCRADQDMTASVLGNCLIAQWFGVTDPAGLKQIIELGGKTVDYAVSETRGQGPSGESVSRTVQQQVVNRYEVNDIAAASSVPGQFIFRSRENAGTACFDGLPVVARCPYHLTQDIYTRRQNAPWPEAKTGMLVVGQVPEPTPAPAPSFEFPLGIEPPTPTPLPEPTPAQIPAFQPQNLPEILQFKTNRNS